MKNNKKFFFAFFTPFTFTLTTGVFFSLFSFFSFLALPTAAIASTFHFNFDEADGNGGNTYLLPAGEHIFGNLYAGGRTVSLGGEVSGDALAFGESVALGGESAVMEDVLAAGASVRVLGEVSGDVRVLGADTIIGGSVSGDVVVVGGNVHILPDALIGGDVTVLGGTVIFEGEALGAVEIFGGEILFNGTAQDTVLLKSGMLTLGENTKISGDLSYSSREPANIATGSMISGKTVVEPASSARNSDGLGMMAFLGGFSLLCFFATLLTALLAVTFLPRFSAKVAGFSRTGSDFWKSLALGFAVLVLAPIAAAILFATLIGSVLGILLLIGYVGIFISAGVYAGILFGRFLFEKILKKDTETLPRWSAFCGVVLLFFIGIIPFIGWIISFVFFLSAFGALLRAKHSYIATLRSEI